MNSDQHSIPAFSRAFRGYAVAEVDAELREAAERIAALERENEALRGEAERSDAVGRQLQQMLAALQENTAGVLEQSRGQVAAMLARADDERRAVIQNARDEASLVIRDAERRAAAAIDEAERRRAAILEEIGLLHGRRMALIARLRALFSSQAEFLASLEGIASDPAAAPSPLRREEQAGAGLTAERIHAILGGIESQDGAQHGAQHGAQRSTDTQQGSTHADAPQQD